MTQLKKRTLLLGGLPYTLEYVKGLRDEDGTKLDGRVLLNDSKIQIEDSLGPQATQATIWHEIIHIILIHAGYRDHSEQLIETLTFGIMSAIAANKLLLP